MDPKAKDAPVVIFCSVNRPAMLHESILCVSRQSIPCRIVVSVPGESDVARETRQLASVTVVYSAKGLTRQRNAAMDSIQDDPEMIFFLDDDMEMEDSCVEKLLLTLRERPDASMATCVNVAQGTYAAGTLDRETARRLILERQQVQQSEQSEMPFTSIHAAYGCMMALRGSLRNKVRFDERLPLYGFLEDFDFSLQCRKFGPILQNPNALAVHIEVTQGRMGDKKRGYSEVVNPFYILSKKTGARWSRVFLGSMRRTLRSAGLAVKGQGWQRLIGNLMGWANVATLRPDPEKILTMR